MPELEKSHFKLYLSLELCSYLENIQNCPNKIAIVIILGDI